MGRSYLTLTKDVSRVMTRIKARYRSWAIPCSGATVYAPRHRAEWLAKIAEPGVRLRAERFYQQLDLLEPVRQEARRDLLSESRKHPAVKLLRQIPSIGPIRAAMLVALLQTPTVSAPNGNYGRTVASPSRLTTAASTAMCGASCNETGSA